MIFVSRRMALVALWTLVVGALLSSVAQAQMQARGPQPVLQLPWGGMGATVGRHDGLEGASEGPMSFALADEGQIVILDQVNSRLAWFDRQGVLVDQWPLPVTTFQELELWPDGRVVLLDRLKRASLVVMDASGTVAAEVGIVGKGIPEGGGVTGMFAEPDGIWLEFGHLHRVHVLDAQLQATKQRHIRRGRRFDKGREIGAELDGGGGAILWKEDRHTGQMLASHHLTPAHRIARIVWLEVDASQTVHALFHLLEIDPHDVTRVTHEEVLGMRFDAQLNPLATYRSPHVIRIWEQFREVRIDLDGSIYQMAFDTVGMRIVRWTW